MIVPPYVPDILEVEGNVAGKPYRVRLEYIRKVVAWHYLSVLAIVAIAAAPIPSPPITLSAGILGISLLALSVTRQLTRPHTVDQLLSLALTPILAISLAMLAKDLFHAGFPVWTPVLGLTCTLVYTFLSGRDFSFVWMFLVGVIASSIALWGLTLFTSLKGASLLGGLALNAAYLLYFVYDLACTQSRRRRSEIAGAVIDLYRDVLNFLTYSIRVFHHWKRYRIWSVPKEMRPKAFKR